jgi:hypothetical protein
MDIFKIINIARTQLDEPDLFFHEECATILALLRAKGILAVNRTQVNGQLHYLFGATLVAAYNLNTRIYITSRMYGKYVEKNVSTKFINWLDACVKAELLVSHSSKRVAKGYLDLGVTVRDYIKDVQKVTNNVERWNATELIT